MKLALHIDLSSGQQTILRGQEQR
uniref:Uncharacterized protein n=1 Tax=Anguilla anguilla TaxID=7936 RepID=A0A0E9T1G9_ANGAN